MFTIKLPLQIIAGLMIGSFVSFAGPRLDDSINELNAGVTDVLKKYQSADTIAKINFDTITTDGDKIVALKADAYFRRVGTVNTMEVIVPALVYSFANGAPFTTIDATINYDFTKSFGQQELNGYIPEVVNIIKSVAKEQFKGLGDAVEIDGKLTEENKDAAGNYLSVKGFVTGHINPKKLPAGKTMADVAMLDMRVDIAVELKQGIALKAIEYSNPSYNGMSLKTQLEKFLAHDAEQQKKMEDMIKNIDEVSRSLVEKKAQ